MSKHLTQPGDTLTEGFGPDLTTPTLLVTMTLHEHGIAFYVSDGVQRVAELCRAYTDRAQAIAFYRHVRDAAMQGTRIYQIVWEVQALEEAQNAATGRTAQEIAEAINAEVDTHHAATVAAHNEVVTTVAEVMAGTAQTGGWNGARKTAQTTARATSQPMDRILTEAATNGGRIVRSRRATSTQLVRLAERGLVELTYGWRGNQRVITGGILVRNLNGVAA